MAERLLVVEDSENLRRMLVRVLGRDFEVDEAGSVPSALALLGEHTYTVVLTDVRLPGGSGNDILAAARRLPEPPEVVLMTAYGGIPAAVEALRQGAYDYLAKPFEPDDMVRKLKRAADRHRLVAQARELGALLESRESALIGQSAPMAAIRERLERIGPMPVSVLLRGESGTGKEVAARELHRLYGRGPFVAVNCGAIPENLLEAELFGVARGAYTGAVTERKGLFEAAAGGTLFLDEIGDLPLTLQVKLNRALEEGEIRRVGETLARKVEVRLVAATQRELEPMVASGSFRGDLYYRLKVVELRLPPLRERAGDVPLLAARFLQLAAARFGTTARRLELEALERLERYGWPGNVRELRHALEHAAVMSLGDTIAAADLPEALAAEPMLPRSYREVVERAAEHAGREYLVGLLRRTRGNVTEAAAQAGVERETMHRLLRRHGLDAQPFREEG
jgi:DNA-binding NtrC family response regulator